MQYYNEMYVGNLYYTEKEFFYEKTKFISNRSYKYLFIFLWLTYEVIEEEYEVEEEENAYLGCNRYRIFEVNI